MGKAVSPWSVLVTVDDIPETGLHLEIEAPEAIRAELVKFISVRALLRLSVVFDLSRRGAGVHVAGQVTALVGQDCVVTLEPMETQLDEAVDLVFVPGGEAAEPGKRRTGEEPPEPLIDGKLDLGAIATEFLVLGIDPYPRRPGAEFAPPKVEDAGPHPFAALEALKKPSSGGQS